MSHPSKDITGSKGNELAGQKIALLVSSSFASFKVPEIAQKLMRHGADVQVIMSQATEKMIGAAMLEWATGNPVVHELTGKLEHIAIAGHSSTHVDLVLIAPATANTIGKLASGIDDTPVTTVAATAIGSKIPVLIAPAMHEPLYDHPLVQQNIARLEEIGVQFVQPEITEGKAKIAGTEQIVRAVITKLAGLKKDLAGHRVLVTGGPTIGQIDPVRMLTNRSSGKMGVALAEEVASRGAQTTLILGPGSTNPPQGIRTVHVESTEQMLEASLTELREGGYDLILASGAPSDYKAKNPQGHKIETRKEKALTIDLEATPKIIAELRKASPKAFIVAFKTESNVSENELVDEAFQILREKNADLVAANDVGKQGVGFQTDTNELYVVDGQKTVIHIPLSDKRNVARQLVDLAVTRLKR